MVRTLRGFYFSICCCVSGVSNALDFFFFWKTIAELPAAGEPTYELEDMFRLTKFQFVYYNRTTSRYWVGPRSNENCNSQIIPS